MTAKRIAIIGSGIVGSAMAHEFARRGHQVTVFEKGPAYSYPHSQQWQQNHVYFHPGDSHDVPADLKHYTSDGISFDLETERYMRVGGSATVWEAICIRMGETDFETRRRFGYGDNWPIGYNDLEPYFGRAETLMGVAGTDDDNPFAPLRSTPYPLPHFELAHDDVMMQSRLADAGIVLHTTPQARTRAAYDNRPPCVNFGTCRLCPIGARYSPNYHLQKAVGTGNCQVISDTSVRRIIPDASREGGTVIYRQHDESTDQEYHADIVIVAAGAIESARLLLLSASDRFADGLGNASGWVGRGFAFHHVWKGRMRYAEALHPFRFGGWTGQSLQFVDVPTRGQHAAVKVEFSTRQNYEPPLTWETARQPHEAMEPLLHWRQIILQAEAPASEEKYVTLSPRADRFGDPFPHIHYRLTDFDIETYHFARDVFDQFVAATRPVQSEFPPLDWWDSGSHHMGGCRMGRNINDSVVNSFGQLHDQPSIFVVGGGNFVGSSGAMNPTLTILALALRSAEYILDQLV